MDNILIFSHDFYNQYFIYHLQHPLFIYFLQFYFVQLFIFFNYCLLNSIFHLFQLLVLKKISFDPLYRFLNFLIYIFLNFKISLCSTFHLLPPLLFYYDLLFFTQKRRFLENFLHETPVTAKAKLGITKPNAFSFCWRLVNCDCPSKFNLYLWKVYYFLLSF